MKQEDWDWLTENSHTLGNTKLTIQEKQRLFDLYNSITGEKKPVTSCGRCVHNIKKRLIAEYEKVSSIQNGKG